MHDAAAGVPTKGQSSFPSPKNLRRLLAELIARDWAESTSALALGASLLMAALWVSLSKEVRFLKALRLVAKNLVWLSVAKASTMGRRCW